MRPTLPCAALLVAFVNHLAAAAPPPAAPSPTAAAPIPGPKSELSFCQPPFVQPRIIEDLLTWESDGGDQVVAINLSDSNDSNRYDGAIQTSTGQLAPKHPMVTSTEKRGEGSQQYDDTIGYTYIGTTSSGVHVLNTWQHGGGTMVSNRLLLLTVEEDRGLVQVPASEGGGIGERDATLRLAHPRLLLRKLGELVLGDRWDGELRVDGNRIVVGKDQGHFSDVSGEAKSPYNNRNVVLQLEDAARRPAILRGCP